MQALYGRTGGIRECVLYEWGKQLSCNKELQQSEPERDGKDSGRDCRDTTLQPLCTGTDIRRIRRKDGSVFGGWNIAAVQ